MHLALARTLLTNYLELHSSSSVNPKGGLPFFSFPLLHFAKIFSFGKPANALFFISPVLIFLLIAVCPKIIEFCVPWVSRLVGCSFCQFGPLNSEK